jgi:NADH:ubiquinone oxidoreductase subunit 5 (subunit L)/multisubunit Na+/H+ antiporter MnhA subunit
MPRTGAAFLVGSAAICGLPPLNGFVSEFLVYLGAFSGIAHADRMQVAAACLVTVGALALIGGLAAACFAKVVGIVFLGEGRTAAAQQAQEVQTGMRMPMLALAVLCVLIGLLGPAAVRAVQAAAAGLLPAPDTLGTAGPDAAALLRPVSTAGAVLATLALALWALRRRLLARRSTEETGTWDCGYAAPTARMQYTASSFAWPILDMFRPLLRIRLDRRLPSGLFPREASLESHAEDVFLRCGYGPVFRSLARVAERLRRLQQGRNQLYVLYITLTLLILLLWKLGMVR